MPRPTKLTPEVQRKLVGLTRAGVYLTSSAPFVGVTRPTVRSWIRRGEAEIARVDAGEPPDEAEQPYVEFALAMSQAKAYANIMDMAVIRRAAEKDPYWALQSLKLRNPEWFRSRVSLQARGVVDGRRQVDQRAPTPSRGTVRDHLPGHHRGRSSGGSGPGFGPVLPRGGGQKPLQIGAFWDAD